MAKITWKDAFDDFKITFPNLSKLACDYRPYDFMTIVIWLNDGRKITYDMTAKEVKFLERWKEDVAYGN